MKSALCLLGIVGGTAGKNGRGETVDFVECARSLQQHVIQPNNCDVFFHTWSVDHAATLRQLYRPKAWRSQQQVVFGDDSEWEGFRMRSKLYSMSQAVHLKQLYEREHRFCYDYVMTARFDLICLKRFNFAKLRPSLYWVPNLSDFRGQTKQRWHVPPRVNISEKKPLLHDVYGISNSLTADKVALLGFQSPSVNIHKALWQHVSEVLGDPRRTVGFYGWRGYEWDLYRYRVCQSDR